MNIKRSYLIAGGLLVLLALWFVWGSRHGSAPTVSGTHTAKAEDSLPNVVIDTIYAEPHENYMLLHGRTEADREVSVKAETAGLVVRTPVREGTFVRRGTLLCKQDIDARQAQLDQAKALLRTRELEYEAALTLVKQGYRSSTQSAAALAALDGAKAGVKRAEIELGNVNMRAPFDGIFERQIAEIGDYLAPGQPCGLLVDLDPLIVKGEVTEKQVARLSVGDTAFIQLATGESLDGKVRLIETKANPATRTFRIEIAVPNKSGALKAGVSAKLKLSSGMTNAHLIPGNVLTLNDEGRIGVRYLDYGNIVKFTPVTTVDETPEGLWVTGLDAQTDLIVRGQDYVAEGIEVTTKTLDEVLSAGQNPPESTE